MFKKFPLSAVTGFTSFVFGGKDFNVMQLVDMCVVVNSIMRHSNLGSKSTSRLQKYFERHDWGKVFVRHLRDVVIRISGILFGNLLIDFPEVIKSQMKWFFDVTAYAILLVEDRFKTSIWVKQSTTSFGTYMVLDKIFSSNFTINDDNLAPAEMIGDLSAVVKRGYQDENVVKLESRADGIYLSSYDDGYDRWPKGKPRKPRNDTPGKPRSVPKRRDPFILIKGFAKSHGVILSAKQLRTCKFWNWYKQCKISTCTFPHECTYCSGKHTIKECEKIKNAVKKAEKSET